MIAAGSEGLVAILLHSLVIFPVLSLQNARIKGADHSLSLASQPSLFKELKLGKS